MTVRLAIDGRELEGPAQTGIGRYVVEVLRAASQAGWECLVYGETAPPGAVSFPGVTTRPFTAPTTWWWDQITLPRRLKRDRVSVFLSPYYKMPLLSPCPVVVTIHDLYFIDYPGARRPCADAARTAVARLYARRARAIIADSEFSKQSIIERLAVPGDKIRVIPIAADPRFRPVAAGDDLYGRYHIARPYVLYVGNFKPHKNLPRLLDAYAGLPPELRTRIGLVLAGGDREGTASLTRQAEQLGLADRVRFPGVIPDEDLPALYSGASLVVLPSLIEGYGLPALEAMQCGTPVAASRRAAIPEVVGDAALLFDPEDVPAMTGAMTRLLGHEAEARDLARRGLARAATFSHERTSGQVLDLLRSICSTLDMKPQKTHEVYSCDRRGLQ